LLSLSTVRNFVFGRNVTTPTLNVLIAFFGLSQGVLPRRNFARFLLTLFIMWSLIIRTCYQGKLFEYLQGDMRNPEIQTIKELVKHNFIYYYDKTNNAAQDFLNLEDRKLLAAIFRTDKFDKNDIDYNNWEKILKCYLKSPSTSVLIADTFHVIDYHSTKPNKTWLIMNERLHSTFFGGLDVTRAAYLAPSIRSAIENLTDNGIINYLMAAQYDKIYLQPEPEPKEPEVLTLGQLAIGFKLYGIFVVVSLVAFLVELLNVCIRAAIERVEQKLFEKIIEAFFKHLIHH